MTLYTPRLIACALALGVSTLASAQETPAQKTENITFDTVVATVNGTEITAGQLMLMRLDLPQQYQTLPTDTLFDALLEQAINQQLYSGSLRNITPMITASLLNEERVLRAATAIQQTVEDAVTEAAMEALYQEKYGTAEVGTEYHASHILVETEDEAQKIVSELLAGGDFEALAAEQSLDPSGHNGGDLGWFGKGLMVEPFETAVIAMNPGEISQPVQTQFGWHVIKLMETRVASAPSLDDVREELDGELRQRAIDARLNELLDTAKIDRTSSKAMDSSFLSDPNFMPQ